jgi:hypothetical protein
MPLDPEDIKAYHDQLALNNQEAYEAKEKINIADYLDEAYSKSGFLADLAKNLDSDDFYRLAKLFENAGDAQKAVEWIKNEMRKDQVPF